MGASLRAWRSAVWSVPAVCGRDREHEAGGRSEKGQEDVWRGRGWEKMTKEPWL